MNIPAPSIANSEFKKHPEWKHLIFSIANKKDMIEMGTFVPFFDDDTFEAYVKKLCENGIGYIGAYHRR